MKIVKTLGDTKWEIWPLSKEEDELLEFLFKALKETYGKVGNATPVEQSKVDE